MTIGTGVWAFVVYIAFVIIWNTVVKRNIAEAMAIGLVIAAAFSGFSAIPSVIVASMLDAMQSDVMLAIMLFMFMSTVMAKTGIISRLVNILNSLLGKIRGGPAYVSACASALFGMVSGSGAGNSATVGSITVPWMVQSGWPKNVAATMNAGNAGLGIAMPPSSSMLLMLGFATVAEQVNAGNLYFALLCGGLWTLLYRMVLVRYYVRKYNVPALPGDQIESLGASLKKGGTSLFMFLGIAIPMLLTVGPISVALKAVESFGKSGVKAINIIVWVPVMITLICMIEGHKLLPKTVSAWKDVVLSTRKTCATVGGVSLFALAGSEALTAAGFGEDLQLLLESLSMPKFMMVLVVGIIIAMVAGPLNATATTVGLGPVAYAALTGVGVSPTTAVVAFLIFASTEGASPPSSSPIFISCSIAEVEDVTVTFKPLIFHYVIPVVLIGVLIAMGILPIING
ncbi:MAG: TRAP transporter large permease subunit [Oscillospiraceae bacterium]